MEDGKWLSMEVRKEEWKVHYGESEIAGAGHKTWGEGKSERE
jgi:hypothetical protein